MNQKKRIIYADDDYESVWTLLKLREPSLVIGLFLGIVLAFFTSRFEEVLARNVQIAFFIPFVTYIAASVGTQTQSIYARDLKSGKTKFSNYLKKESALGIIFGLLFGTFAGVVIFLWLGNDMLAISVAIATFLAVALAPFVALLITEAFQLLGKDPAAGAGPIATVIQDIISVLIYSAVSSMLILT